MLSYLAVLADTRKMWIYLQEIPAQLFIPELPLEKISTDPIRSWPSFLL